MNTYDINSIKTKYQEWLQNANDNADSLENFELFLQQCDFSTPHAEDIYEAMNNEKPLTISTADITLKKRHAQGKLSRDNILKKAVIPATVVGAIVSPITIVANTSNLIKGAKVLGMTMTNVDALNWLKVGVVGFGIGAAATVATIAIKKGLTIGHYKAQYGTANQNVNSLSNGTELENTRLVKLLNLIEKTNHNLLETKQKGLGIKHPFRTIKYHIVDAVNRNRIHHVESVAKDLVKIHNDLSAEIETSENATQLIEKQQLIKNLVEKIDNFICNDLQEQALFESINCENKSTHSHKLQNADIYANISDYFNNIKTTSKSTKEERRLVKEENKEYVLARKNNSQRISSVVEMMSVTDTNKRLIAKMLKTATISNETAEEIPVVDETVDYEEPVVSTEPEDDILPVEVNEPAEVIIPVITDVPNETPAQAETKLVRRTSDRLEIRVNSNYSKFSQVKIRNGETEKVVKIDKLAETDSNGRRLKDENGKVVFRPDNDSIQSVVQQATSEYLRENNLDADEPVDENQISIDDIVNTSI